MITIKLPFNTKFNICFHHWIKVDQQKSETRYRGWFGFTEIWIITLKCKKCCILKDIKKEY
jgi:hypothetical protein